MLALIEQQDLKAVSIADVTRRAGVSRSTFYDHYADLHELAESACPRTGNPLVALFEHVLEHRRLYTGRLGPDGSARVMGYLMRRMTITIHVNRALPDAHFAHAPRRSAGSSARRGCVVFGGCASRRRCGLVGQGRSGAPRS